MTAYVSLVEVDTGSNQLARTFELAAVADARQQLDLSTDPHRITTDVREGPRRSFEWTPGGKGCCLDVHLRDGEIEYLVRAY